MPYGPQGYSWDSDSREREHCGTGIEEHPLCVLVHEPYPPLYHFLQMWVASSPTSQAGHEVTAKGHLHLSPPGVLVHPPRGCPAPRVTRHSNVASTTVPAQAHGGCLERLEPVGCPTRMPLASPSPASPKKPSVNISEKGLEWPCSSQMAGPVFGVATRKKVSISTGIRFG